MSQPEPNLTVVIPVHNAAPHLGACVESLLAQSYTDFELILVENGSSDDSRERCAREDHLFFFTCISRMQSVVWRSGLYMHYMRRGRNTLSTRPMPACELVEAAERLDRFIPQLAERFGITDKAYLFALRQNLVRDTLLRAANNIRFGDRRSVLGAIAARPELFGAETYTPRWHPLLKRPLLDRILKGRECHTLLYLRIALRRSSLRLRGRFNA